MCNLVMGQLPELKDYNTIWEGQSQNSAESMPVGGGDIGLNVWVENNSIYAYFSRSGTFDEHNTLLKLGRLKLELTPNPFEHGDGFRQELVLQDGYVKIQQNGVQVDLWVDVFDPVIHLEVESKHKIQAELSYENWRYKNKHVKGRANNANSYKWAPQGEIITYADTIKFQDNGILFFHRNRKHTVFDVAVKQQGLEAYKDSMMNPLENLTFGGHIQGSDFSAKGTYYGVYRDAD